jgi:DNA-binding NarL/FixJ family response regulator
MSLTLRQQEMVPLVARGLTDDETGELLRQASVTVALDVHKIQESLSLTLCVQLVVWAMKHGLD